MFAKCLKFVCIKVVFLPHPTDPCPPQKKLASTSLGASWTSVTSSASVASVASVASLEFGGTGMDTISSRCPNITSATLRFVKIWRKDRDLWIPCTILHNSLQGSTWTRSRDHRCRHRRNRRPPLPTSPSPVWRKTWIHFKTRVFDPLVILPRLLLKHSVLVMASLLVQQEIDPQIHGAGLQHHSSDAIKFVHMFRHALKHQVASKVFHPKTESRHLLLFPLLYGLSIMRV